MKWLFAPYVLGVSGILCKMCWDLCAILGCVAEGLLIFNILVLLPIPPWYCCLFLFGVDLFLFEFSDYWCWLLWPNISFNLSGKSFSNVGRNPYHSNCICSIWILYLLLICIAFFLPMTLVHVLFWFAWICKVDATHVAA